MTRCPGSSNGKFSKSRNGRFGFLKHCYRLTDIHGEVVKPLLA